MSSTSRSNASTAHNTPKDAIGRVLRQAEAQALLERLSRPR
jgi:hypothetical protein